VYYSLITASLAINGQSNFRALSRCEQYTFSVQAVASWCAENSVSLVVVGPEQPLADGIADVLRAHGVDCFGPGRAAARIESDKHWAKSFMARHDIPTARWAAFTSADEAKSFIARYDVF
jgi:phosphoribosylamine-glycine ligase